MSKYCDHFKFLPFLGAALGLNKYINTRKRDSSYNNGPSVGYIQRILYIQNVHTAGIETRAPLTLVATNNPHIPFTTSEGKVKLAEYTIPPSGIKNFYIALDGSRFMNPNYTVAISKLPDEMQIHLDYKDIKDIPFTTAHDQSYPCTLNDQKKGRLTVLMKTNLKYLDNLGINNLGDYVDHCIKREGDDKPRPFKGEGHYEELHNKMCDLKNGEPRLYPEGQECSFAYDNRKNDFFLRNIPDIFYPIRMRRQVMPGVSGSYVYVGGEGSAFPIHVEDALLLSLNYMPIVKDLPGQGEKLWISFHVDDQDLAMKFFKDEYPTTNAKYLTKVLYLRDLNLLAAKGIRFQVIRQTPGTMIWTNGLHAGLNTGVVLTEALNAATVEWVGKYHRFPKDKRLMKPKQNKITPIQFTKDFSKGIDYEREIDGELVPKTEKGAPLYAEHILLGRMFMVSQILLHKFFNHFDKDPITQAMSPIERRLFIEAVVGSEQRGLDFLSVQTWEQVRKEMYVMPEGDSNCEDSIEDYLKSKDGTVYSDLPLTNESPEKTTEFAKHMAALRDSGWIKDLITSLHVNWNSDYIEQDFHKALAEQRAMDPPGTWPNKYAETLYGKKKRNFTFELDEGERYPSIDEGFESGNDNEQKGSQPTPNDTPSTSQSQSTSQEDNLTQNNPSEPPSAPQSQSTSQEGELSQDNHVEPPPSFLSDPSLQEEELTQNNQSEFSNTLPPQPPTQGEGLSQNNTIEGFTFPISPTQNEGMQKSPPTHAQSLPKEDLKEALNRSISLITNNDTVFGSVFEGKSDSERAGFLLAIRGCLRSEELKLFTDESGEPSTQRSDISEGLSSQNESTRCTVNDEKSEQIGGSQSSFPEGSVAEGESQPMPKVLSQESSTSTSVPSTTDNTKKISRKRKITVNLTKKELGSAGNKLYISTLMSHFQFEVKTPAPPHHLNSQSGFFYEIVTGKTKLILQDPIKIGNLIKTLAVKIGSDDEFNPKDLVGLRIVALSIWERLLKDSGYTTNEAEYLASVIYQSLVGSQKFKAIEYRRLDFVLRTYINSLSKAANKGAIPMSKNQEEWLSGEDDKLAEIEAPMKFHVSCLELFNDAEEDKDWDEISSWIKENWLHLISLESDMERMDEAEFAKDEFLQGEAKERITLKADH